MFFVSIVPALALRVFCAASVLVHSMSVLMKAITVM